MAHIVENTNHPCYGMDCKDCDTCIFDVDLFKKDKMKETCNSCNSLVRNYLGDEKLQFNACCDRCIIQYVNYSRPRTIKYKVGEMLSIETPEWCPKKRGVSKEYKGASEINTTLATAPTRALPAPTTPPKDDKKVLTYAERKELLMKLPKRLKWEEIEEGEVYVIPKILSQSRKVVRVVVKTETLMRCSEIDEFGKESQVCSSIYPSDIDTVFITKIHKF